MHTFFCANTCMSPLPLLHPSFCSSVAMALNLELNSERYILLLEKLIGETEFLQNNPPHYIPQEDRYWAVILLCVLVGESNISQPFSLFGPI